MNILCANCFLVTPDAKPGQTLCEDCAAERERIRKLKWEFKRLPTPARAKRCRPRKDRAA